MSFDLWMSRVKMDTFVLIVHFLKDKWEPCHVTIGFFETTKTSRNAMALQVNEIFVKHGLNVQVITTIKDETNNLSTMTTISILGVSCEVGRGDKNGTRHVWVLTCPQISSRIRWRFNLLFKSFCSKRLWNSSTPSPFIMEGDIH